MESNQRREGEAGFSVIEGLIAAALLLIITVGVLPLFSRSILNNLKGNDSTRQSNGVVDEFERSTALPFNSGSMEIPGTATNVVETRVLALKPMPASPGRPLEATWFRWELPADLGPDDSIVASRQRRLQHFSFDDFNPTSPAASLDDPLAGDAEDRLVHLKVVDVELRGFPQGLTDRPYRVRMIQAF